MPTDYNPIAAQYKKAKLHPWRLHIEHFTLFELLGDLRGKSALDLACGEGFITRSLAEKGARRVVGVDLSSGMIELARAEEARRPLGLEYQVHDVMGLDLKETFDLVVAGYLLNYARTRAELLSMCTAIARHLKPGCRFVTVNSNPDHPLEYFDAGKKYGYLKTAPEGLHDGAPIVWTFLLDEGPIDVTNYYLNIPDHDAALRSARLKDIRWHAPRVSPAGLAEKGEQFWAEFLDHPPVIFLECSR